MDFYGYFHLPTGVVSEDRLAKLASTESSWAELTAPDVIVGPGCAAWGQQVASMDGVAVAVRGSPVCRDDRANSGRPNGAAESILHDYSTQGDRFLDGLAGRFAVAVLDARKGRAVLAVDPMGIERVAFASDGGSLIFGASAELVARTAGRPVSLSSQALLDYLLFHMIPAPRTAFEGVRKLRPGYCAVFENGELKESRYWNIRFIDAGPSSFRKLREQLHESLRTAVRASNPDDRCGAFLSGGLDSSTVAGVLSEVGPAPTKTFSIGFGYPAYDELSYARIANRRFGCKAHEYTVTGEDIAKGFPLIAKAFDEPFGNSSALPVYFCARLARSQGVDHLLAGDGGDELFAGNSRYAEQQVFEWYKRVPSPLRHGLIEPTLRAWPSVLDFWLTRKARGYVEKANIPLPARLETWNLLYRLGMTEVLHPDFRSSIDERGAFLEMQQLWDSAPCTSALNHMLYYDWQLTLADNDLRKVETMSALAGVRVTYPMLHPDVVELSTRIPPQLKMPGTRLRHFYKRAMAGYLPDEIIDKKKHGFGLPFGLWLQESPALREQIHDNLSSLRSRRIVRPQFIDRLLNLHGQDDARYHGVFIWVLAMLEQWLVEHDIAP